MIGWLALGKNSLISLSYLRNNFDNCKDRSLPAINVLFKLMKYIK